MTAEISDNTLATILLQRGAQLNGMQLTFRCPSGQHNGHAPSAWWDRAQDYWLCPTCGQQPKKVLATYCGLIAPPTSQSPSPPPTPPARPLVSDGTAVRPTSSQRENTAEEANAQTGAAPSSKTTGDRDSTRNSNGWPVMDTAAFHGLVGDFINTVKPHSETDPVGLLLQLLVGCGSVIGPQPHALVEQTPHPPRLNALLIGKTAKARKGTAWNVVKSLLKQIDPAWAGKRVKSGLSSGEGLVFNVRDADGQAPGEPDKRLLVIEEEFASPLKKMQREGNTLSPVMRDAWDHGNLSPLTKTDRIAATGAHISIIGHSTVEELLRYLTATERGNGFANRFLFALVQRSKLIPSGRGTPPDKLAPYFSRFSRVIQSAGRRSLVARDKDAEALWTSLYPELEEDIPGLTGEILGRGAPQTLRLSLVYSLLDEHEAERPDPAIRVPHLQAAVAVWNYCKASAFFIFGDSLGNPDADLVRHTLKAGLKTDSELSALFGKDHKASFRKDQATAFLCRLNRAHSVRSATGGRPGNWWHYGTTEGCGLCGKSPNSDQP